MALKRSFDWLARPYQTLEYLSFGRQLEAARFAHVDQLHGSPRVLILGEGDGRFLERALRLAPSSSFDVVDKSVSMLRVAQARTGSPPRVRWIATDARTFVPRDPYDAIVTLFFLDCFPESDLNPLIARLSRWLRPGGKWLYADFHACSEKNSSALRTRVVTASLYFAFRCVTDIDANRLHDPRPLLRAAGLEPQRTLRLSKNLLASEVWGKPRLTIPTKDSVAESTEG